MIRKLLLLYFFVGLIGGQVSSQTVTITAPGNGTFTVPCDVTSLTVEVWGAGGAGGGSGTNNAGGGGGGGGGYAFNTLTVISGQVINYTIGIGGNGNNNSNGQPGGNTTFLSLTANGGAGGLRNAGAGGAGGGASGGSPNTSGANGIDGSTTGGKGGDGANGGAGGIGNVNINGSPGTSPGGGGGGGERGSNNRAGGNGGNGQIRITYISAFSTYNAPTFQSGVEPITNVTFAGINRTTSATVNGTPALESFCDIATVLRGNATNPISLMGNTGGNYDDYFSVYIDWNHNGTFDNNTTERYYIGTIGNSTGIDTQVLNGNISVPAAALLGLTKMRVMKRYNAYATSATQINAGFGQAEEYVVNVLAPAPCSEPTAQATNLVLSGSGTTISGSFTAASPAPDSYLVVYNTTGTPPTPSDGTAYTIGGTVGVGNIVADIDGNTSFAVSGLAATTPYYFFVFAYNNAACTANYLTSSPLTGTKATGNSYCAPTSFDPDGLYINRLAFVGALVDPPANNSTYSASGYQDFTGLSPIAVQAQGEGVNVVAYATGNVLGRGTWKAWIDWNKNGVFSASELIYDIFGFAGGGATFGFKIPAGQAPGDYRIRIRINNGLDYYYYPYVLETFGFDFGPCDPFSSSYDVDDYGETEDYLFTVIASCPSLITDVVDDETCGNGSLTLGASGTSGVTEFRWYTTETGGVPIATTAPVGLTTTWTTPVLSSTTSYYVTAFNGNCESLVRTEVIAKISPIPVVTFTPSSPIVCGNDDIIQLTAQADTEKVYLIDEKFDVNLGEFYNINSDGNPSATDNKTRWANRTSVYIPTTNVNVWYPAISSGFGPDRFALAISDPSDPNYPTVPVENSLTLINPRDTADFINLTLELEFFYSRYLPGGLNPTYEYAAIELSTNNGATYPIQIANFTSNQGIGTRFVKLSYDLTAYINQPNLKIRIRQYSYADTNGWLPGGIAVDNIQLYGDKPLNTAFNYDTTTIDAYTDAAGTLSYTPNTPITTIYIKPSDIQLENASFTISVDALLSNDCSATGIVNITNNTKVWRGNINSSQDWEAANNWRPIGVPTADNCVIIPSNVKIPNDGIPTPPILYEAYAKNVTIKSGGNLEILSGNNLTVTDWIHNEGTNNFDIRNDASLIQINDVPNTGPLKMDRTAMVKKTDYVYYSSPVDGFSMTNLSTGTPSAVKFKWIPTTNPGGGFQYGNWATAGSDIMGRGVGYIVRGPSTSLTAQSLTATFDGTPRNGNIAVPITRGTYSAPTTTYQNRTVTSDDDNYNLIGNPYPSAISANAFLGDVQNNNILGSIYLWPHGGVYDPSNPDPFYQDFVYNYDSDDYITYNYMGPVPAGFNGYVAAGQSFFVLMTDAPGNNPSDVYFKNGMRVTNNNNQFLRTTANTDSNELNEMPVERHRIYLDLILPDGKISSTLVGYTPNATYDKDRLFDSPIIDISTKNLYSKIGDENMIIQGRPMPFDQNDQVSLGVLIPQQGIYTFAISSIDGLFTNTDQDIFLEDLYTGIIHNLKNAPYMFNAPTGRYDDRFILRYTDETLSTPEQLADFGFNIIGLKNYIKVTSGNSPINTVTVYDVLGRILADYKDINTLDFNVTLPNQSKGTLIVKATLYNGQQKIKKVIH